MFFTGKIQLGLRTQIVAPRSTPAHIRGNYDRDMGCLPDGRRIYLRDERMQPSSGVVCEAIIYPPQEKMDGYWFDQIEWGVAKFANPAADQTEFQREKRMLKFFADTEGIPKIIGEGEAEGYLYRRGIDQQLDETIEIVDKDVKAPFFVMTRMPGSNISNWYVDQWDKSPWTRDQVARISQRILPAFAERLGKIHAKGVVHRDVKPPNAVFENSTGFLSVVDFEKANFLGSSPLKGYTTVGFYPPEMEIAEAEDVRMDTYGFGVSAFFLLNRNLFPIYEGMENPFQVRMDGSQLGARLVITDEGRKRYYAQLSLLQGKSVAELLSISNMPWYLRSRPLGRYIVELMHPNPNCRPSNMYEIAEKMRQLGGEFDLLTVWE